MAESGPILFIGTRNPHKVSEFQSMAPQGLSILPAFSDQDPLVPEISETGESFFMNAAIKAFAARDHLKSRARGFVVADDSGLVVPSLNGEPGVRSARYAGEDSTDLMNRELLILRMKGMPPEKRKAYFVCVLVAVDLLTGQLAAASRGEVPGHIANGPMGEGGFGYDPVFVPDGYRVSFGIMASGEKNRLSHRTLAFRRLCRTLEGE